MRIFIGLKEIANLTATYVEGFHTLGHETHTLVKRKHRFFTDSNYDVVLEEKVGAPKQGESLLKRGHRAVKRRAFLFSLFLHSLFTCDVFIFIFGTSFLPMYLDYPLLKAFRKKIVSIFCGSDILYPPAYEQEMCSLGLGEKLAPYLAFLRDSPMEPFNTKIRRVRAAERYADLILSGPSIAQLQSRPYMRIKIPLPLTHYKFSIPNRDEPLVIHAPSVQPIKGTEFVIKAVEQLYEEGLKFDFQLIEDLPHTQMINLLMDADIVVDQLFSQTIATLALEAMATGNAVLTHYLPEFAGIPPSCPVVNVTKNDLTDGLRTVIVDRDLRKQLAHAGRDYVEMYHDHKDVSQQILDWLEPNGIQDYDFYPTFFQRSFSMPVEQLRMERKHIWNRRIKRISDFFS
jgi:glycosyltransferase involved in cell wall biosynthesis